MIEATLIACMLIEFPFEAVMMHEQYRISTALETKPAAPKMVFFGLWAGHHPASRLACRLAEIRTKAHWEFRLKVWRPAIRPRNAQDDAKTSTWFVTSAMHQRNKIQGRHTRMHALQSLSQCRA
jgi:hypothetical protein